MTVLQNNPLLWRDKLPVPDALGHKYGRGVAVIFGAPKMTGATRLAARACARIGAGLVRVIAPEGTGGIYRATLDEEIVVQDAADFEGFDDSRIKAVLIGSGFRPEDVDVTMFAAAGTVPMVLDAGAFRAWPGGGDPSRVVVTPHEGEFAGRFGKAAPKISKAEEASRRIGATIVLKGPLTVIAGAGETIVQDRAVPELATAGTGDVLAGMIAGLLAQGMEMAWACAAAIWIHAEAAERFGRGMVASDLPDIIPAVLKDL